jgi:hypothetical protein
VTKVGQGFVQVGGMAVSQVDELTGGKVTQYSQAAKSKLQSWATWLGVT